MSPLSDLREASKLLRRRVAALPPAFPQGGDPWRPVLTDSESVTGVAACWRPAAEHSEHEACDHCWTVETYNEAWAEYMASTHALVGLALAELLESLESHVTLPRWENHLVAVRAVELARTYLGRRS